MGTSGVTGIPATYGDFVVWTRQVVGRLRRCDFKEGKWQAGRGFLLHRDALQFWTEHSERKCRIEQLAALIQGQVPQPSPPCKKERADGDL